MVPTIDEAHVLLKKHNSDPFHLKHAEIVSGVMEYFAKKLGYGITVDIKPEHTMEKVLYATDELTGLIGAAALMRPSKSVADLELKSVKKKFKSAGFAAGCSRTVISNGAEMLGWSLDDLITETILAMRKTPAARFDE